ncbi:hypothetical protein MLD38_022182 [Melastoma candidum]|uniref:Uncharacterized protein n=1 Tax=Melastoma candidum TaxID=119954 RepID=A0ACB9QMC2_9MYRT|nr:hypothetical protein MLD38_022182 [Melastoma candidum]
MDRYQRVEKPKADVPIDANEIRITSQGRMRSYITYAMGLLQEKDSGEIVFKAMGRAINKTVTIVELIKRRITGIHQVTSIGSTDITDTWEPLEEGLLPIETTRHVSMITITLSKKELDTKSIGYQPPLPADQVKPHTEFDNQGDGYPNGRNRVSGGRGRPRARGNSFMNNDYDDGWDHNQGYASGRGRGRGRGFRGRGRGGYNGPRAEDQQDGEYYEEQHPAQGRGFRGRGRGGYNGSHAEDQQDGEYYEEHPAQNRGFRGRVRGGGYNGPQVENRQDGDYYEEQPAQGRGFRGRGRGGYSRPRGENQQDGKYYEEQPAPGRGFRRQGRGGYNGPPYENQQDGGYYEEPPAQGRGRGGRGRGFRGRGRGFQSNRPAVQED